MKPDCQVRFAGGTHPPITLARGANLSEHLTVENSPVLFGCRTGICGTCLVQVEGAEGALPPASDEELQVLDVLAPGEPRARLACQLDLACDIVVEVNR